MTRWYEDIAVGEPFPLGSHDFTEAEIIRFAQLYDPQYFHLDPEAARQSHFGGLVASGWHTVTVGHRHMVDALFAEVVRTAVPNARLCFRNFVGWTEVPPRFQHLVREDRVRGEAMMKRDRSVVQRRFAICRVNSLNAEAVQ